MHQGLFVRKEKPLLEDYCLLDLAAAVGSKHRVLSATELN
jgi:hypothetical protein